MDTFAICAIIKNEGLYLKEWFEYHFAIGVDRFYLVLNDREPYLVEHPDKRVTVFAKTDGVAMQLPAYQYMLNRIRGKVKWAAFIDADEFIVPKVEDSIKAAIATYKADGILVPWKLFGSNGLTKYDSRPVVERFTRRQRDHNPHVKTILKPYRAIQAVSPHAFTFVDGARTVNANGGLITNGSLQYDEYVPSIQINHYVTKSLEECTLRRRNPRADNGSMRDEKFFAEHDTNEVEDLRALHLYNKYVRGI